MVLLMSVLISNIPNTVMADVLLNSTNDMISTKSVLFEINRETAENEIRNYLQQAEVQKVLIRQGISAEETSVRLASLSQREINQLYDQVKEARAGGDILITIILVLLIIFLFQRI